MTVNTLAYSYHRRNKDRYHRAETMGVNVVLFDVFSSTDYVVLYIEGLLVGQSLALKKQRCCE